MGQHLQYMHKQLSQPVYGKVTATCQTLACIFHVYRVKTCDVYDSLTAEHSHIYSKSVFTTEQLATMLLSHV